MKGFTEPSYRKPRTRPCRSLKIGERVKGSGGTDEIKNSKLISLPEIAAILKDNGFSISTKNWAKRKGFPKPIESKSKTRFYRLSEVKAWMGQYYPKLLRFLPDD
jgi:predicted DNA-binding transcriptional regulator AlpA